MDSTGRPATAADVAAHAGVSRATVSHILNGRVARFPQSTRDRVQASVDHLDYRPSPAGRSLVRGRGDTIVFVMPDTTMESNIQDAVEWIARTTAHIGANVVLRLADPDPGTTVSAILRMRPLGVVDFGFLPRSARERLAGQGVPTVPRLEQDRGDAAVDPDEVIARMQVERLSQHDHRQILYAGIADRRGDAFGPRRFAYIEKACAALDLQPPVHLHVPLVAPAAAAALAPFWDAGPVGVAAYNDVVAVAVLSAAADQRLRVPQHVAVVGNDHTAVGQLWRPRLTTIKVDVRVVVDSAIEQLLTVLDLPSSPVHVEDEQEVVLIPGDSA